MAYVITRIEKVLLDVGGDTEENNLLPMKLKYFLIMGRKKLQEWLDL